MKRCEWCNAIIDNHKRFCNLEHYWKYSKGKTFREYKKGYHLSEETKQKIAEKAKGRHHSLETKKTLSKLYLGKTYKDIHGNKSEQIKNKISESLKKRYANNEISNKGGIPYIKSGYRKDIKMYVRSSWEANIVRIFNYLKFDYKYEYQRFILQKDNKIISTYLPDFFLPKFNIFIEVKGYMSDEDLNKINLFKELYSMYKLIIINKDIYSQLFYIFKDKIKNLEPFESSETNMSNILKDMKIESKSYSDIKKFVVGHLWT
ncbi:MAG: hypothetical protein ACFFG0_05205, partial [Candidatus Thorarchaeota archaeon]